MSLSNTTVKAVYVGNGSNKVFAIPFSPIVDDSAETKVYLRDETDPDNITEELLEEGALNDYTLTGAPTPSDFHVNVTLNTSFTAPTASQYIVVIRELPLTQTLDMSVSGFRPPSLETAYDRIVAMIQQLGEKLTRVPFLRVTERETEASMQMPEPVDGGLLAWKEDGTGWEFLDSNDFAGPVGPTGPVGPAPTGPFAVAFTPNLFSGTGAQTAFTLSSSVSDENSTFVYVEGVYQQKDTYSVSGTTLTFSVAPPSGTNNIEVLVASTTTGGVSTFNDNVFDVHDEADATKKVVFSLGGATTAKTVTIVSNHTDNRTITLPDENITLGAKTFNDNVFDVHDEGDATKKVVFSLGGATTNKTLTLVSNHTDNRTITFPDKTATLATESWTKYTRSYTDFSTGSTTNAVTLFTLAAKQALKSIIFHHTTNFTGGGITAYSISIGKSGDTTYYMPTKGVFSGQSNTNFENLSFGNLIESMGSTTDIILNITSVGANLSSATAGSVDIYVETYTLP